MRNIEECYDLQSIVRQLELALQVDGKDYEEMNVDKAFVNIIARINQQYGVDLSEHKIGDSALMLSSSATQLPVFVDNIAVIHSRICGYTQIARYRRFIGFSLADVNYFGSSQESLKTVLLELQRKVSVANQLPGIGALKNKMRTLSLSIIKRLLFLMLLSFELGFYELTAAIAELFYHAAIR